ncbi:axoneme-associated protein mst101(2)-like [Mercenaria mercenaria]|uniref:axoneme-associated protein mst101(2)-like n=1 Tax=Mercenaria mercenaria TaxID=6596 RepID=UPI00234FA8C7|nr:axoneme-associated protein mst101(2)-like [Mercenaria mercenaria]XP_045192262.2 axoneme-associated protein mst101(2)-like [Mercenaria mercenaria]
MPFFCNLCGTRCRSKMALESHSKSHYDKNRSISTTCDICKRKFSRQHLMEIHRLYIHTHRKTELKCTECGKVFGYQRSLKRHMMSIHLNMKNHVCPVCGKSFSRKEYLSCHLALHYGAPMKRGRVKRLKSCGKKLKTLKTERNRFKTEIKTEGVEHKKMQFIPLKNKVLKLGTVSRYKNDIIRGSKKKCARKRTATSRQAEECKADNCGEPDEKKLKIEETKNFARSIDIKECKDVQSNETDNKKRKAEVGPISTRSTDVKEGKGDRSYEIDNKKLEPEIRSDVKECKEDPSNGLDNKKLETQVRTICTRRKDLKESKEGRSNKPGKKKMETEVETTCTRSTDVKERKEGQSNESAKKKLETEVRSDVKECKEDQSNGLDNKKLETQVRTICTRRKGLKESKEGRSNKPGKKKMETEVETTCTRSTDVKERKECQSNESAKKKLETEVRTIFTRSTYMKECKEGQSNDSAKKMIETEVRIVCTRSTDVKEFKDGISNESGKKKPETEVRTICNRSTDAKECKEAQSNESSKKKIETKVRTVSIRKCTEEQRMEPDKAKLGIIFRRNSETGEWTVSESMKKTVCTLNGMKTSSCPDNASKEQKGVNKNVNSIKTCKADTEHKNTKMKPDTDVQRTLKKRVVKEKDTVCCEGEIENNKTFRNKKCYAFNELCVLNAERTLNVELPGKKVKHSHKIAKNQMKENTVSVSKYPKTCTELTSCSNNDVLIVELFEDGDTMFSNDVENTNNSDNASGTEMCVTEESVDIKVFPYKYRCTNRKALVKNESTLEDYKKDAVTTAFSLPKRDELNFSEADVEVIDCSEDENMDDCNSDIESDVENQVHCNKTENQHNSTMLKPKKVLPLAQSVSKHAEYLEKPKNMPLQHVVNRDQNFNESLIKGGDNGKESDQVDDVNVECEKFMSDEFETHMTVLGPVEMRVNSHANFSGMLTDSVGKKSKKLSDKLSNKHRIKSQAVVKGWTICKRKALGLNDKSICKRNDVLHMNDSVKGRSVVGTSTNRTDRSLHFMGNNQNHEQIYNETFVSLSERRDHISMLDPGRSYTDVNKRAVEEASDAAETNFNEFCLNQSFPSNSIDSTTENFKDVENLLSWTAEQILHLDHMPEQATSRSCFEHQYDDFVPEFNEKEVEHSDENNDGMIEVYVIDDEVDENNNSTSDQIIIYDNDSASTKYTSQESLNYGNELGLFVPTDFYQTNCK